MTSKLEEKAKEAGDKAKGFLSSLFNEKNKAYIDQGINLFGGGSASYVTYSLLTAVGLSTGLGWLGAVAGALTAGYAYYKKLASADEKSDKDKAKGAPAAAAPAPSGP